MVKPGVDGIVRRPPAKPSDHATATKECILTIELARLETAKLFSQHKVELVSITLLECKMLLVMV
jgi:hypothetical protein